VNDIIDQTFNNIDKNLDDFFLELMDTEVLKLNEIKQQEKIQSETKKKQDEQKLEQEIKYQKENREKQTLIELEKDIKKQKMIKELCEQRQLDLELKKKYNLPIIQDKKIEIQNIIEGKIENNYIVDDTYNVFGEQISSLKNILIFIRNKNKDLYNYVLETDKKLRESLPDIQFENKKHLRLGLIKHTTTITPDSRNTKYYNVSYSSQMITTIENVEQHIQRLYFNQKLNLIPGLFVNNFLLNYNYNNINGKGFYRCLKREIFFDNFNSYLSNYYKRNINEDFLATARNLFSLYMSKYKFVVNSLKIFFYDFKTQPDFELEELVFLTFENQKTNLNNFEIILQNICLEICPTDNCQNYIIINLSECLEKQELAKIKNENKQKFHTELDDFVKKL